MSFDELLDELNDSCLSVCGGQEFAYLRVVSLPEDETGTFVGIIDTGAEPEEVGPGDGSTYMRVWGGGDLIGLALLKGDEVSTATTVYKIVNMHEDEGRGLWLLLRQDRAVS
jgi:hypothetical protein